MQAVWPRRALSALLAAGVALAGWPAVGWAQTRPDLTIEYSGFSPPNTDRTITFTVTNVGQARSSAIKASIVALDPPPPNLSEPEVPRLNPGQSHVLFYGLSGAGCNGHEVRALVNDPRDLNGTNDHVRIKPCGEKVTPASGPPNSTPGDLSEASLLPADAIMQPGPSAAERALPRHLLPGTHTYQLDQASVVHEHLLKRTNTGILGSLDCPLVGGLEGEPPPIVGFVFQDFSGCDINNVSQLILNFDLQWLRDLKNTVTRAELLFDEQGITARNNDGEPDAADTCIGRLGLAPPAWPEIVARREAPDSLKPTLLATKPVKGDRLTSRSGATIGWSVTDDIRDASLADNPPLAGLVLHGLDENLDAESERSCWSHVLNVKLKLEYEVFP